MKLPERLTYGRAAMVQLGQSWQPQLLALLPTFQTALRVCSCTTASFGCLTLTETVICTRLLTLLIGMTLASSQTPTEPRNPCRALLLALPACSLLRQHFWSRLI